MLSAAKSMGEEEEKPSEWEFPDGLGFVLQEQLCDL